MDATGGKRVSAWHGIRDFERRRAWPREDFIAPGDHESFAFAIDASGKFAWESNDIDGDHVVACLSERVSDQYLEFLRGKGVSYPLAGAREVEPPVVLESGYAIRRRSLGIGARLRQHL